MIGEGINWRQKIFFQKYIYSQKFDSKVNK